MTKVGRPTIDTLSITVFEDVPLIAGITQEVIHRLDASAEIATP